MCKVYITNNKELSDLEQETLESKFRKKPHAKHKTVFCQETRSLIIAANYKTSWRSTKKAIKMMQSIYKPSFIEVTNMRQVA